MTTFDDRFSIVAFLAACSNHSLADFLLAKQNRVSILEKDLRELIARLGENIAYAELANLLREFERLKQAQGARDLATSPNVVLPPNGWIWILDRADLTHNEQSTLLAIKSYSNGNHVASVASCQLSRRIKLGLRTVERALAELRKKQFIECKFTGKGQLIRVLEPPPVLFSAPPPRRTCSASQADMLRLPGGAAPPPRRTLYVNQYTGTPASSEAGLPGRDPAITPGARASDSELRKLELQAEILGRTERLQKSSGLGTNPDRIAQGPQTTGAIRPEVLKRIRERDEKRRAARK